MATKGKENTPHIGIFGKMNNGKSSIINCLAGQDIAIVSNTPGTTTDPVKKSVEVQGIGPAIFVDTAGIDDTGDLGSLRTQKAKEVIKQIDLAILVITNNGLGSDDEDLITQFKKLDTPFFIVHNKSDENLLKAEFALSVKSRYKCELIDFSAIQPQSLPQLLDAIRTTLPKTIFKDSSLLGGLLSYGDIVLLITPIDIEAPEGRLILPQVQAIRDILDNDCVAIVIKEREVDVFLKNTGIKPALVVTDSQVFLKADASIPKDIPLTSFSIMLAKHKGDFDAYVAGTPKIGELKDGDRVLMLESCTHQVSCDDIGRVKIPRWITNYTGKKIDYDFVAGLDKLERPMEDYALVVQCGGCVVTRKQLGNRLKPAIDAGIPVTNYGMAIAYVQGIYNRSVAPFIQNQQNAEDYL